MKPTLYTLIAAFTPIFAEGAEPLTITLTSAQQNIHVDAWQIQGADITPTHPNWSITKQTLHGGKQEGVDIITINNGKLSFSVIPTRGMGILNARMDDIYLGWQSPVKEVVHPKFVHLEDRGGLGWLEGFNEWLVRCGLESNGHPGTDSFINNVGDEATMDLTLHGKIANIPASEVEVVIDRAAPYRIHVRGRVDERMFYGPKLELWSEVSTTPDSASLRISDTITNRGDDPQEFQILYHANYGPPLLEQGASFLAPIDRVIPFNDHAAKSLSAYAHFEGPTPGFTEQVYCITTLAGRDGRTTIGLVNRAKNKGIAMTYQVEQLPYLTLWKNTNSKGEGYVTGLEPGTNFPNNRRVERKFNRVPKLQAGESHHATIDFTLLKGADAIQRLAESINQIQRQQKPKIQAQPEDKQ
ncbi:MAG: aldose 1-epimerase family protein [Verrucomicrobiota bacterium]|jgi:hypothetical protein|nr:aldose 1-epimerase family protein [Verrucomicrobiota bacterium]